MASVFITEYRRPGNNGLLSLPALAAQVLGLSTAVSTGALGANTEIIGVQCDQAAFLYVGSSASTGVPSSTNGARIPASAQPQYFNVPPYARVCAISS